MPHTIFIAQISQALSQILPGKVAHEALSPAMRFPPNLPLPDSKRARRSAVLLLLYPHQENKLFIALMQRSIDGHTHSGQISFPGGGVEHLDRDWVHTALRETNEEFGFDTTDLQVLGLLTPLYIPVSNSWVQPVVAYSALRPHFQPNAQEVAQIIEISLADFLEPTAMTETAVKSGIGYTMRVPAFVLHGYTIWGATAMILNEFLTIVNQQTADELK